MWRPAFVLLVSLMTTAAAAPAGEQWIGEPTIGDYIRRDFAAVMQAQQETVRSKTQFNAQIAEARAAFLATATNPAARAGVEQRFADLLFAKDLIYATTFIAEGFSDQSRLRSEGLHALTGGKLDNGIPEDGQRAFEAWVTGIRASLGATSDSQMLFLTDADAGRLQQALVANETLYKQYKVLRDQQELNGGISQNEMARRAEAIRVGKSVAAAKAADGSARLFKQDKRLLAVGDWRADLETFPLRQLLFQARAAGQQTLRCTYGPSLTSRGAEGFAEYTFWAGSAPANIDALMQTDAKGALQYLGRRALDTCPASDNAALAITQAAMAIHPLAALSDEQKQQRAQHERDSAKAARCDSLVSSRAAKLASLDPADAGARQTWENTYASMARQFGCDTPRPVAATQRVSPAQWRQQRKVQRCATLADRIASARDAARSVSNAGAIRLLQSVQDTYRRQGCGTD